MVIFGKKFIEMFIEQPSMFHMTFFPIVEFDWLSGRQKGLIFVNYVEKSSQKS